MSEATVLLRFSTKLVDYQMPDTTYSVPVSANRLALSKLVNHILQLEKNIPFDFIIGGNFLRRTIDDHITERQISKENVIEVEYTVALPMPKEEWSQETKNWVTSMRFCSDLLFAGYQDESIKTINETGVVSNVNANL